MLNIVIPMAGLGRKFVEAGYAFPKAFTDISGKTMIEIVVENIKPKQKHRFIFVCLREQYEKYDLYNILKRVCANNFEVVLVNGSTAGAACTVLAATEFIDTDYPLMIANADQFLESSVDKFLSEAGSKNVDGLIMTFPASHPKWSYARVDKNKKVQETAEKKIISSHATVGIYYFKRGKDFVKAAETMIRKHITHGGEFYVCPIYNELIIDGKHVFIHEISVQKMHSLATPEDVDLFKKSVGKLKKGKRKA